MTNYSCRAGPKTCFTWKILLLFNWTQSLLRKTCSKNHKGGLPWGSWVCGVCTEKSNKQKATLGIVPVVPVVPVDISHRCLGWDTTSWCLVYLFLFVSITFLSVSISMFYLDIPGFYLPMRSRSARRSITCRLKIMRATELPSRIGGCMAQHGAWCNRSQSVWSKHGTLKAFQHTSLEQGIFGIWELDGTAANWLWHDVAQSLIRGNRRWLLRFDRWHSGDLRCDLLQVLTWVVSSCINSWIKWYVNVTCK